MSLEEIGVRLKSARDNSGLSLSQINERTKIPFNHLEAIEQGNFDDLPEPVYVAGFIKRYADCVGLDGQRTADEYRQELDNQSSKPDKSSFRFKGQKNHGANAQPVYYNRKPIEQAPPNLIKMVPFYALWVVVILALVVYLFNRQESIDLAQQDPSILALKQSNTKPDNTERSNSASPPKANPTHETVANDASSTETNNTANAGDNSTDEQDSSAVSQASNSNQITVLAKRHVWVEIKAMSSGEALYTGFMEAGASHSFSDQEGLRIRAGNAGNVTVTCAGKTEELGSQGKIAERTFTIHSHETANVHSTAEYNPASPAAGAKKTAEKQSAGEKQPVVKKPLVATGGATHKQVSPSQSIPAQSVAHKYGQGDGTGNKAIDLPYRYNE